MVVSPPVRASRSYLQRLSGTPERVFPLLCPVRECDWIPGWAPELVISQSGLAEDDCVFTTRSGPDQAIWYITRHDPEQMFVEMLRITPGVTASRLRIQVSPAVAGSTAEVTYAHTSLGPRGDDVVSGFTAEYYESFMKDWERRLNHYLTTGEMLRSEA